MLNELSLLVKDALTHMCWLLLICFARCSQLLNWCRPTPAWSILTLCNNVEKNKWSTCFSAPMALAFPFFFPYGKYGALFRGNLCISANKYCLPKPFTLNLNTPNLQYFTTSKSLDLSVFLFAYCNRSVYRYHKFTMVSIYYHANHWI